jgi:ABC-2 type transport system permease protein
VVGDSAMKIVAIALTNLRRLLRDPIGLFFIFVLPIVLIITIGSVFGGGFTPRLGIAGSDGGPLEADLVERLKAVDDIEVVDSTDRDELLSAVERGTVEGGLIVPEDYDSQLRRGEHADITFLARPASFSAFAVQSTVAAEVNAQAAQIRAATFAADEGAGSFGANLDVARSAAAAIPEVEVSTAFVTVEGLDESNAGRFDFGAAQELVLFMFLTSLSASAQLIQTRRLGVSRRMISTPTSIATVLAGETAGRFGIAMVQGLFIVLASALLFGVDWGDPLATGTLVVLFALVGTGAAMLFGALFNNDEQANSVGVFVGLGLAALGGCMVPIEVFPSTMEKIAHVTPHAWAVEGLTDVVIENAGVSDILVPLGVLAAFAGVLLTLATWRLNRSIVGA